MFGQRIATLHIIIIIIGLIVGTSMQSLAERDGTPRTFLFNQEHLALMKQAWLNGDTELEPAFNRLFRQANRALNHNPVSVTTKVYTPPSGDKHDYLELDPKYWPNPDTPDGLPWIQTGERNPDADIDGKRLKQLGVDMETLSLAYFLSGDEVYAEKAALLLRVWFLEPATAMTPHMTYGKVNPNTLKGGFPIARATLNFIRIFDSAGLLESSPFWPLADQEGLQQWARAFLSWMESHPVAVKELETRNNHGTFYDLLAALLALYTDQEAPLRAALLRYQGRMSSQIAPDGSQPIEMKRTDNFFYHTFNLTAAILLARLSEHVDDIDLLDYETEEGGSLRKALTFLIPYVLEEELWPFYTGDYIPLNPATAFKLYHRGP